MAAQIYGRIVNPARGDRQSGETGRGTTFALRLTAAG
jgi:hypothetical protein